jgi:hypothetical protein
MHSTNHCQPLHICARRAAGAPALQRSVRCAHAQAKSWILRRNETQRTHKQRRNSHRTSGQLMADVEAFVSSPPTDTSQAVETAIELLRYGARQARVIAKAATRHLKVLVAL